MDEKQLIAIRTEARQVAEAMQSGELMEAVRAATIEKVMIERDLGQLKRTISARKAQRTKVYQAALAEHGRIEASLREKHDTAVAEVEMLEDELLADLEQIEARIRAIIVRFSEKKREQNDEAAIAALKARRVLRERGELLLVSAGATQTGLQEITIARQGIERGLRHEPAKKAGEGDRLGYGLIAAGNSVLLKFLNEGKISDDDARSAQRYARLCEEYVKGPRLSAMRFSDEPRGRGGEGADPVELKDAYKAATACLARAEQIVIEEVVRHGNGLEAAGKAASRAVKCRKKASGMAEAWLISGCEALTLHFGGSKQKRAKRA